MAGSGSSPRPTPTDSPDCRALNHGAPQGASKLGEPRAPRPACRLGDMAPTTVDYGGTRPAPARTEQPAPWPARRRRMVNDNGHLFLAAGGVLFGAFR
jgi:hypothetical protein